MDAASGSRAINRLSGLSAEAIPAYRPPNNKQSIHQQTASIRGRADHFVASRCYLFTVCNYSASPEPVFFQFHFHFQPTETFPPVTLNFDLLPGSMNLTDTCQGESPWHHAK